MYQITGFGKVIIVLLAAAALLGGATLILTFMPGDGSADPSPSPAQVVSPSENPPTANPTLDFSPEPSSPSGDQTPPPTDEPTIEPSTEPTPEPTPEPSAEPTPTPIPVETPTPPPPPKPSAAPANNTYFEFLFNPEAPAITDPLYIDGILGVCHIADTIVAKTDKLTDAERRELVKAIESVIPASTSLKLSESGGSRSGGNIKVNIAPAPSGK